eukprot:TRINITY_DN67250_c2_g2_i1.p1 TRINITY_DN67250_c2_g2~~TRINITY_DN67250_c2_g2_i1.p1  ORF type:complete len:107 (+),score=1.75 TRINITY_DN67250_c2_g2_i1:318-638(+)
MNLRATSHEARLKRMTWQSQVKPTSANLDMQVSWQMFMCVSSNARNATVITCSTPTSNVICMSKCKVKGTGGDEGRCTAKSHVSPSPNERVSFHHHPGGEHVSPLL